MPGGDSEVGPAVGWTSPVNCWPSLASRPAAPGFSISTTRSPACSRCCSACSGRTSSCDGHPPPTCGPPRWIPVRRTRFWPTSPSTLATPSVAPRSLVGRETVLLVEDEEQIPILGRRILERHGYTVRTARTPEATLGLAVRHQDPIHLLITDVVMLGMNGKKLRQRLSARHPPRRDVLSGRAAGTLRLLQPRGDDSKWRSGGRRPVIGCAQISLTGMRGAGMPRAMLPDR